MMGSWPECKSVEEMLSAMNALYHKPIKPQLGDEFVGVNAIGGTTYTHIECQLCRQTAIHRAGPEPIMYGTAAEQMCPLGLALAALKELSRGCLGETRDLLEKMLEIKYQEFDH